MIRQRLSRVPPSSSHSLTDSSYPASFSSLYPKTSVPSSTLRACISYLFPIHCPNSFNAPVCPHPLSRPDPLPSALPRPAWPRPGTQCLPPQFLGGQHSPTNSITSDSPGLKLYKPKPRPAAMPTEHGRSTPPLAPSLLCSFSLPLSLSLCLPFSFPPS